MINKILNTDALSGLGAMDSKSVNTIVTSPPYFGLRAYGTTPVSWPDIEYRILGFPVKIPAMSCELGHEPDHFAFIGHLVLVFREARRVLRDDGTAWINIGDSYAGYHGNSKVADDLAPSNKPGYIENMRKSTVSPRPSNPSSSTLQGGKKNQINACRTHESVGTPGLKPKDLIGIPWMLAYALRDDGWYLRMDIIWNKPNPMPESVTDRPTKSHEYIFLLSKSERYYYDAEAIKTPPAEASVSRWMQDVEHQNGSDRVLGKTNGTMKAVGGPKKDKQRGHSRRHAGFNARWDQMTKEEQQSMGANKRSVWTVTTKPFADAHFATFPQDLIVDCIKAGCPVDGVVLDMFMGSGTTAIVSRKLGRNYIGMEMNPEYIRIAEKRIYKELGIFK